MGNKDEVLSMASNAGCMAGDVPFNYLGLPIGSNMKSIASWKTLVDRFHMRLSSWKANLLSIGGRLTLIKFVLGSLVVGVDPLSGKVPRIPFTKFFMAVLKYFRVHISQLSPFGAARVSYFEVLTRVLNLSPSVTVFGTFYTRSYSDGLFSFAKRSTSAPSCFSKPPDSIKNWADHFFWVDSCVFLISVSLYTGGILEKDSAPHLTACQEQTVKLLESHKAPFRRYPECFLCLVGLSPYYPFDENSYLVFEYPNGSGGCYFPLVVVQKGDDQVTLLESTRHCFMPLVIPAAEGSSSATAAEVSASTEEGQEDVAPEEAYLELEDPDEGTTAVRQSEEEVVTEQPKKVKKKRLLKQSDVLLAKMLRVDHPTLISGTGGKTLAGLEHNRLVGS
ncbi:hypothetical protein Tco_0337214 [Tanacetum coccineum]